MTRAPARGIVMEGAAQLIFVDTPGLFAPKRRLDRAMTKAAWEAADDADCLVLLVDARAETRDRPDAPLGDETQVILEALSHKKTPKVLALNKIDAVERPAHPR